MFCFSIPLFSILSIGPGQIDGSDPVKLKLGSSTFCSSALDFLAKFEIGLLLFRYFHLDSFKVLLANALFFISGIWTWPNIAPPTDIVLLKLVYFTLEVIAALYALNNVANFVITWRNKLAEIPTSID